MSSEKILINEIRAAFAAMQTYQDFLDLMNKAKPHVYGKASKPFTASQFKKYASHSRNPDRYISFSIRKKSGGERVIHAPVKGLRAIQRTLAFVLQSVFDPHPAAMGFTRARSIVDNARKHEGQRFVYNIDLKDFFPSIEQARVWKCLQLNPFNLNDSEIHLENHIPWDEFKAILNQNDHEIGSIPDFLMELKGFEHIKPFPDESLNFIKGNKGYWIETTLGKVFMQEDLDTRLPVYVLTGSKTLNTLVAEGKRSKFNLVNKIPQHSRKNLAGLIAGLACTPMEVYRKNDNQEWDRVLKNVLPQGAPTSPVLTNVICQRLDFLLSGLAKRFGLKFTRYADDISFSSMHDVYQEGGAFLIELQRIISNQGFVINPDKTRLQKDSARQEVTGLVVNQRVNVRTRYIKQIRNWLYLWERYGYDRANELFLQDYNLDKGHVKKGQPNMMNVVGGKLNYLKMVKGSNSKLVMDLLKRYNKLGRIYASAILKREGNIEKGRDTSNVHMYREGILSPTMANEPEAIYDVTPSKRERNYDENVRKKHLAKTLQILAENGLSEAMRYYQILRK